MFWGQVGIGVLQLAALGLLTVLGRRLGRVVERAVKAALQAMQADYCATICPVPRELAQLRASLGMPPAGV